MFVRTISFVVIYERELSTKTSYTITQDVDKQHSNEILQEKVTIISMLIYCN